MPRSDTYHELGWAIDHVMSAPNVRAKTQEEIGDLATKGGYRASGKLVGTYMRVWPPSDSRAGRPRSRPPFAFVWALIRGGNLTKQQALQLTDAWLEIQDEDDRESLRRLCGVLAAEDASSSAWRDMLDLETGSTSEGDGDDVARRAEGDKGRQL